MKVLPLQSRQSLLTGGSPLHAIAAGPEQQLQRLASGIVVVNHQYACFFHIPPFRSIQDREWGEFRRYAFVRFRI